MSETRGAEFAADAGARLRAAIPPGAITAIAMDPADSPEADGALAWLLHALERHGVARGRAVVLLAAVGGEAARPARAQALRARFGVTALAHDPARSRCFRAGVTPGGIEVEVSDDLREAEALVILGRGGADADRDARRGLVIPGLASRETGLALARAPDPSEWEAARAFAPASLDLGWPLGAGCEP